VVAGFHDIEFETKIKRIYELSTGIHSSCKNPSPAPPRHCCFDKRFFRPLCGKIRKYRRCFLALFAPALISGDWYRRVFPGLKMRCGRQQSGPIGSAKPRNTSAFP
jgi:hypothetical protein